MMVEIGVAAERRFKWWEEEARLITFSHIRRSGTSQTQDKAELPI